MYIIAKYFTVRNKTIGYFAPNWNDFTKKNYERVSSRDSKQRPK